MQIGLQVPDFTFPGGPASLGADLATIARTADDLGFEFVSVMDHFFQIGVVGPPEKEMLEAYTTLGLPGRAHRRVKLGAGDGRPYRHPGILAKTVTTLDVLSGGRAWLGIGAAWNDEESRGLGVPFPPVAERFERLEETLRIAHQMWAGDEAPFAGRHYQLARPLNSPQSLTRPHPPIMIGGAGSGRPCGSWRATRTRATSSRRRSCRGSWTCCGRTARRRAGTTTPSARPATSGSTWVIKASGSARRSRSSSGWPPWASRWRSDRWSASTGSHHWRSSAGRSSPRLLISEYSRAGAVVWATQTG